jgi:hypothetical protein
MRTLKSILTILALSTFVLTGCKGNDKKNDHGHDHGANDEHTNIQENETSITVKANSALEYKFKIKEGEELRYDWHSTGELIFDFHGDPAETDKFEQGYFKSYAKGKSTGEKGIEKMPFIGSHGWYWKNTSDNDIKVTLKTKGNYIIIGKIQ